MNRTGAVVFLLAAFLSSPAWGQLANSPWPDYGGGYANQHRSPIRGPVGTPSILWEYNLADLGTSSFERGYHQPILLPDGTIVLNTADTSDDQIVALNPDGTLRWNADDSSLGPWLAADINEQIYTIRESRSYSNTEALRAVDFDGNSLWGKNLTGTQNPQNGPAIGLDGKIYAAVDFQQLDAFSFNGVAQWTSAASSGYYVNPAIATDGTIYLGGQNLTALAPNGSILWTYAATAPTSSFLSPAIDDNGVIYAGQITGKKVVALTPAGAEIWARTDLDGAPAIGIGGEIYVVPQSGILTALDPANGTTLWTYNTGKTDYYNSEGVTVDVNGNLYMCNEEGILRSFTPDGQLLWSLDLAPNRSGFIGTSAPVIGANGKLYVVGGNTGKVFAIVPEPSSLMILLSGVLGVCCFAWRRIVR